MDSKNLKKLLVGGIAAIAVGGSVFLGAASVASADSTVSPSSPSSTASATTDGSGSKPATGKTGRGHGSESKDTVVTGDEATNVSAAVTAKDSAVSITEVRKDSDGSYDVVGTKDGANVMYEVSSDLATVTQAQAGGKGKGGRGGESQDTVVSGDEATKVSAAVTAKDSAVSITEVRKDPDGSYDVVGTNGTAKVFYEVSSDLATVTTRS